VLEGIPAGTDVLHDPGARDHDYAFFNGYTGTGTTILASVFRPGQGVLGRGIAVRQNAGNRHVLLSMHGSSIWSKPSMMSPTSLQIMRNSIAWAARFANQGPSDVAGADQYRSDGTTIEVGGRTTESAVTFKAIVSDPDGDDARLQVEVKPLTTAFDGTGLVEGSLVGDGAVADATAKGLAPGAYHWRARAVDEHGAVGDWLPFGGNEGPPAGADFYVAAELTITASSPDAISYGDPAPEVTAAFSGFVPGDDENDLGGTLVCGTAYTIGDPPGTYSTSCSGATSDMYEISYVDGSFVVERAPLTITANSTSKVLGAPDPPFGVTYEGFLEGEDESVLAGTLVLTFEGVAPTSYGPSTTPPQARGSYTLTPSNLTSSNYSITFVPGSYTISGAYFIFLDGEAIRKGSPPRGFTAPTFSDADINEGKARVGQRDPLAWFGNPANYDHVIDLPSGQVGDEGWFALTTVPPRWAAAGPTDDALRNLLRAGPGLGGGTDREALLDKVRDVTPLRAAGLKMLEGSPVCAIVWKGGISINYSPLNGSLKGDNRGVVAFQVVSVARYGSGSTLPRVSVRILEPRESVGTGVCNEPLALLADAPKPVSSSSPMDVVP
jgi:hypothetical protein